MKSLLKNELVKIRNVVVESTDECFCVNVESDDAGTHYVIYLVKNSALSSLINSKLFELKLTKRHMIIFLEEDHVHDKRKENER